jgi:hypothetical protein
MSFFYSSRSVPHRTAFFDANRQLCHDSSAYCDTLKGPLAHPTTFVQSKLESLFASAQSSILSVLRLESESTARQTDLISAFGKPKSPKPTSHGEIASDIANLIGSMAVARADAANASASIGRSIAEIAATFDSSAVVTESDPLVLELQKLRRQSHAERSADAISEADEDDFIIVGTKQEPHPEFDRLVGQGTESDGAALSAEGSNDDSGIDAAWPIMNCESEPIVQPAVNDNDRELDRFWDGLIAAEDSAGPVVDPVGLLLQATVEYELKKQALGKVPGHTRRRIPEPSQTDEACKSLQSGTPEKSPERRPRKAAGQKSQSPP